MARQRDYRAEYAARKARAQEQGFTGYGAQRSARAAGEAPGGRRQIVTSPAGRVVRTTEGGKGFGVIESQLRRTPDARVKLLVTYKDTSGRERQATLYGKGGRRARDILDRLAQLDGDWGEYVGGDIDDVYGGGGFGAAVSVQAVIY